MNLVDIPFPAHRARWKCFFFFFRMLMLDKKVWLTISGIINSICCVKIKILCRLVFVQGCAVMLEQEGGIPKVFTQS